MNVLKLQHKRQRKELKRNAKRKAIRNRLNKWANLGKAKQRLALERTRRTAGINDALKQLNAIVKRWSDKVSDQLYKDIETCTVNLKAAMKTKKLDLIDNAIKAFGPVNAAVIKIYETYEKAAPVNSTEVPVETNSDTKAQ
jgi:hypothetical protein